VQYLPAPTRPEVSFGSVAEFGSGLIEVDNANIAIDHENWYG
jgi:hypothetical protein